MITVMGKALYPPVTPELLQEVVRCILSAGAPRKIVLFGSHARGEARRDSDLDLLIVEDRSAVPTYRRALPYRIALTDVEQSKDIMVCTQDEIEDWRNVPLAFVTTALREGKVLYERHD